jgi:signal transduction histidine kinase
MLPSNHTILLIDDEPRLLMGLKAMIKRAGYNVLAANSGDDGIRLTRTHQPDLILCDVMMPPPDGFTVKTTLAKDPVTASIPFIFLTARTSQADMLHGFRLNSDDYITKPFNRDELLARMSAVLRRVETGKQQGRAEIEPELDRMRREVIQNVSHEFRTPIAVLLPALEIFLEDRFTDLHEEEQRFLKTALQNAYRLRWMVEDVLILSALDQGKSNTFRQPVNPHHHLIDPIYQLLTEYEDKNLKVNFQTDPVITLSAPLPDFTRAMLHLVDNACKFSPGGGWIGIQISSGDLQTVITVSDEGPGISVAERDKVFDRFYQVDQGTTRAYNGLGVGLTVARAVARAMDGDVTILDTDIGCTVQMTAPTQPESNFNQKNKNYELA